MSRPMRWPFKGRRRSWQRNDGGPLIVLVIIIAGAVAFGAVYGHVERLRRSAETQVTIESSLLQPGRGIPDEVTAGRRLRYSYLVRGVRYNGATFRPWMNVEAHEPKVCYDPDNPSDHLLVEGGYRCGR